MRPLFSSLALAAILLTACNVAHPEPIGALEQLPTPVQVNTSVPSTTAIILQHRPHYCGLLFWVEQRPPMFGLYLTPPVRTTGSLPLNPATGPVSTHSHLLTYFYRPIDVLRPAHSACRCTRRTFVHPFCDAVSAQLHCKSS